MRRPAWARGRTIPAPRLVPTPAQPAEPAEPVHVVDAPFCVRDPHTGRPLLVVAAAEDGPTLVLFSGSGAEAARVVAAPGGPIVQLLNATGRPVVLLTSEESCGGHVGVFAATGEGTAGLGCLPTGEALVSVSGPDGAAVAGLGSTGEGGHLLLTSKDGLGGAYLAAGRDGGRCELHDPDGPPRVLRPRGDSNLPE